MAHFDKTVRVSAFVTSAEIAEWVPGSPMQTRDASRGIMHTIMPDAVHDNSREWVAARWELLRTVYRSGGTVCLKDLVAITDEDEHVYVSPSVAWHRHHGFMLAVHCDGCGETAITLTPHGVRLAESN